MYPFRDFPNLFPSISIFLSVSCFLRLIFLSVCAHFFPVFPTNQEDWDEGPWNQNLATRLISSNQLRNINKTFLILLLMFIIPQNCYVVRPKNAKLHLPLKNISLFLHSQFTQTEISSKENVIFILKSACRIQSVIQSSRGIFCNINYPSILLASFHREIEQIRPPQYRHMTKMEIYGLCLAIT